MRWIVSSGDMHNIVVEGNNLAASIAERLKELKPVPLGELMRAVEEGFSDEDDDHNWYVSTEVVLKLAGMWRKE